MTATQLAAMRAGREAQLARLRDTNQAAISRYRDWVAREAQAFRAMVAARDDEDPAFNALNREWLGVLGDMPDTPPDSAWA